MGVPTVCDPSDGVGSIAVLLDLVGGNPERRMGSQEMGSASPTRGGNQNKDRVRELMRS
jgi:hypothetical protein